MSDIDSGGKSKSNSFVESQRQAQGDYFKANFPDHCGLADANYRLNPDKFGLNLAPSIREKAQAYFTATGIAWHRHRNHGLSSQVCCLNFLMPLVDQPTLLARVIGNALGIEPPEMLPIIDAAWSETWFVGFEWIGRDDYLAEGGNGAKRTRGANYTSADAVVRFRHAGRTETLLIEWKYTESYGSPIPPAGNQTRVQRYRDKAFAPHGPIDTSAGLKLEDFFHEPLYQLLRQQMLAWRMEQAREDGANRVRLLHLSPAANIRLHRVTSPAFDRFGTPDVFQAFMKVLFPWQDGAPRFISRTIEAAFEPILADPGGAGAQWADYLRQRYTFLLESVVATAASRSTPSPNG